MTTSCRSLVLLLTCASVRVAHAGGPAGAQAQTLYDDARALMSAGKLEQACASFEASQKLEAAITTLVSLANCREKNHQIATAWGLYLQAERELRAATDATSVQIRDLAKARAAALAPRLSTLAINVPEASRVPGLEVIRNDEVIDAGMWNHALPVDGGTYTVSARAPDRREWSTTVAVRGEIDHQTLDVPALAKPTAVDPSGGERPPARQQPAPDQPPPPPAQSRHLIAPIVLGVAALALGGTALGLEVRGRSLYDDAKATPPGPARDDLAGSANARRYAAETFGIAAIGCAGAAVFMFMTRPSTDAGDRLALAPFATSTTTGLALGGSF